MSRTLPLRVAAAALLLAPIPGAVARAQTVGGQIVALKSQKALGPASVALIDDSAKVVATTKADSATGGFYIDAPRAGDYRVIIFVSGASFLSPALRLDAGQTVERLFSVPEVPARMRNALFATEVTTLARALPTNPAPAYPHDTQKRALVSTMFIVSDSGVPDVGSLQALNDADSAFVTSIRNALARSRYVPAEKDGKAVAQVVQVTYDFGFPNDPPRGDVVVRPQTLPGVQVAGAATGGANPRLKSGSLYYITTKDLAQNDVSELSLFDALARLRPTLFGAAARAQTTSDVSELYVLVDNVPVEGLGALRNIRASAVASVEYVKREQAMVRFGTQHTGGALVVTLRR